MPTPEEVEHGLRFDALAESYDNDLSYPVRTTARNRVSDTIRHFGNGKNILDAGCGTGQLLISVSKIIKNGLGIDVSQKSLNKAQKKSEYAKLSNLTFRNLGFSELDQLLRENYRFDLVVSTYALHHLSHPEKVKVIEKMSELLSGSESMIVIGDLILPSAHHDKSSWSSRCVDAGYDPNFDNPSTQEELVHAFTKLGFSVEVDRLHPLAGVFYARKKT